MAITDAQRYRLKEIVRDIEKGPTHPSENVRSKFSNYSQAQIENAINVIKDKIAKDDGFAAHHIIKAFYEPGGEANVVRYINVTFPKV